MSAETLIIWYVRDARVTYRALGPYISPRSALRWLQLKGTLMLDIHLIAAAVQTQQPTAVNPAGSIVGGLIGYALTVIALWPMFVKAGRPGWGALIPIYNTYLLVKIAGHHGALTILYFIPIVNIVIAIIVALGVGRAFGRGPVFSVLLLWLLAIIGYLILGYGNATYQGSRDTQRTA